MRLKGARFRLRVRVTVLAKLLPSCNVWVTAWVTRVILSARARWA